MRLLDSGNLQARLEELLSTATEVDDAVAWARASGALEQLRAAAGRGVRVRAVVGLAGNHTQPVALRALRDVGELRIADGAPARRAPSGIFHPKVFVFRSGSAASMGCGLGART